MSSNNKQQQDIISATNFNANTDVKYTKPKLNKSQGKSVGILNNSNKALLLSTPVILTWGVKEFVDEQTGKKSYTMALQFPNDEYITEQNTKFLEAMKGFETKLKQDALKYSKEWLNKTKTSAEVVDALFTPMLKYPKDKNTGDFDYTRAPTLNVKIGYWDEKFDCEVYDHEQKQVFPANDGSETNLMSLISKSSNVAVILKCGGLWFANGKFGCTWKLVQAAVKPKSSLKGKCLITMSSDDNEKLRGDSADEDQQQQRPSSSGNTVEMVNDSDDEEENEDAEVVPQKQVVAAEVAKVVEEEKTAAVAAVATTTKKVVRRKVAGDV
jgi:hypothetical protein